MGSLPSEAGGTRSRRGPISLAAAMRRAGGWNLLLWGWALWWCGHYGFRWSQVDGQILRGLSVGLAAWSAFFGGFLTWLSYDLQTRRKLLLGRLEPSVREWQALEAAPVRPWRGAFWSSAVVVGLLMAAGAGLAAWGLAGFQLRGTQASLPHMLAAFVVPTLGVAALAPFAVRRSARRFVAALERGQPLRLPRGRYLILHNVLPYTLFSATAGLVVLSWRFLPDYLAGRPIAVAELASNLGGTALIIALFVVGAARLKTRVDFLSPIELLGQASRRVRTRWRVWYALLAGPVVYGLLRLAFLGLGVESLPVAHALTVKVGVSLSMAFFTALWAVGTTLAEMEIEGLDQHRYVRVHRFLARTGYLAPRR